MTRSKRRDTTSAVPQRFSGCADALSATEGRSPLANGHPRRVMAANYITLKSRRSPVGPAGSQPAIMKTFRDMPLPCWGWLRHTPGAEMIVLGRPLTVRRGDVLHLGATATEPAMIFLVLDELYPTRDDSALFLLGYELASDLRVIGRREVYLKHPDGTKAQYPMWGIYRRDTGGGRLDDDPGGGDG